MGKTVPLDGTLMRESALGGNSLENLGSKANDIMIFKIAGRCIGCILGSYPGDGGSDSHSRYTNFNLKLMVPANRFGVIISYNCK